MSAVVARPQRRPKNRPNLSEFSTSHCHIVPLLFVVQMNYPLFRSLFSAAPRGFQCNRFGFAIPCYAVVVNWSGTLGSFNNGANWSTGVAPGAGDEAHIDNGGTAILTGNQSLLSLFLGTNTGQSGTFQMSAGSTLTTTSDVSG